jgi:hypothetical protein
MVKISAYNALFEQKKNEVDQFLKIEKTLPENICIDPEIRQLIYSLNSLPFVYTDQSASGGLSPEKPCFNGGYILFVFQNRPVSLSFIDDLEKLTALYGNEVEYDYFSSILYGDKEQSHDKLHFALSFGIPYAPENKVFDEELDIRKNSLRLEIISGLESLAGKYQEMQIR